MFDRDRHGGACHRMRYQPARTAPRFATRHDKLAGRYEATVQIGHIDIWLRDLSHRP
jgi:transposase